MSAKPKLGVFVDVQNIYYTTRDCFGRPFDYRKLWQKLSSDYDIVVANAYAIDRNNSQQKKFQNALQHIGFSVKLKPYIQRSDGSAKGDWDVGITIDMIDAAAELDEVLLLSGDGDFDRLLIHLREKFGLKARAMGVPKLSADSLIAACDEFVPIEDCDVISPKAAQ